MITLWLVCAALGVTLGLGLRAGDRIGRARRAVQLWRWNRRATAMRRERDSLDHGRQPFGL